MEVAGEEEITLHILISNQMAGNGVGEAEVGIRRHPSIAVDVYEHLTQSPGEAMVTGMLVEVDALADGPAVEHNGHRRDYGRHRLIFDPEEIEDVPTRDGEGWRWMDSWDCTKHPCVEVGRAGACIEGFLVGVEAVHGGLSLLFQSLFFFFFFQK